MVPDVTLAARSPIQRTLDGIRRLIQAGGLKAGQRLPAEDALAAQFAVSRSTVRKALEALSDEGVVRREPHRGCVVARETESDTATHAIVVVNNLLFSSPNFQQGGGSSAGIQQGILHAAHALDRTALLVPIRFLDEAAAQRLLRSRPAGLAMLCWGQEGGRARRLSELFHAAGIPVTAYGMEAYPEAVERYDRVQSDHESGIAQLLGLLARNGRRRALRVWTAPAETPWIAAHNRAYERVVPTLGMDLLPALQLPGIPPRVEDDPKVFEMRTRLFAGYLAEHLHGQSAPPDAILVATDSETFPVAAACRILGLRPGEDILITGYDNYWHMAFERAFEPSVPFATVDKRNAAIGGELIRLLDQRIARPEGLPPQCSLVGQQVIEVNLAPMQTLPPYT